ncbi:hypothetical protein FGO68_gene10877 [Halteria grandinella]|uniref:Uncharacterized protein n=1 Tax=Halteria grandinella TaxID=5974 RepID=A0A8J8T2R7_HALGN|nr:hypothetical protein FGO68_gene10877 [Halteria grandinella]
MKAFNEQLEQGVILLKVLKSAPALKELSGAAVEENFVSKVQACAVIFDFSNDNSKLLEEKDIKRKLLLELIQFLDVQTVPQNQRQYVMTERVVKDVVQTVSINIFRTPKVQVTFTGKIGEEGFDKSSLAATSGGGSSIGGSDPDEEQIFLEESWPHIQVIYELLLRIIIQPQLDVRVLKNHITQDFIQKLISQFKSPDPRERDYLKTILHRVYGKFMIHRSLIRRSLTAQLSKLTYNDEQEDHFGHSEFLELLSSIISGFAVPLKGEHRVTIFDKCLLPLHRANHNAHFHQQLVQCIMTYMDKDQSVANSIITEMLKYWPVTNPGKEILFLNEIEEVLDMTYPEMLIQDTTLAIRLAQRLNRCIMSEQYQVAERALLLWNNERVKQIIGVHEIKEQIYHILIEGLITNAQSHWNSLVQGLTFYLMKLLVDQDAELFDKAAEYFQKKNTLSKQLRAKQDAKWRMLEHKATLKEYSKYVK